MLDVPLHVRSHRDPVGDDGLNARRMRGGRGGYRTVVAGDEQDIAETTDDDKIGGDSLTAEDALRDFPPDRPRGVPFGDADVTDESLRERLRQEEPEVWEAQPDRSYDGDVEPLTGLDLDDVAAGEQTIVGDAGDESAEEAALHIEDA